MNRRGGHHLQFHRQEVTGCWDSHQKGRCLTISGTCFYFVPKRPQAFLPFFLSLSSPHLFQSFILHPFHQLFSGLRPWLKRQSSQMVRLLVFRGRKLNKLKLSHFPFALLRVKTLASNFWGLARALSRPTCRGYMGFLWGSPFGCWLRVFTRSGIKQHISDTRALPKPRCLLEYSWLSVRFSQKKKTHGLGFDKEVFSLLPFFSSCGEPQPACWLDR